MTKPGTRGHTTHRVGDPLPAVLVITDLARLLGIGRSQAWELEQRGELRAFECERRIGNKTRYSGRKVQTWLDGEPDPTDGRIRTTQESHLPRRPDHTRRAKDASEHGSRNDTREGRGAHA